MKVIPDLDAAKGVWLCPALSQKALQCWKPSLQIKPILSNLAMSFKEKNLF